MPNVIIIVLCVLDLLAPLARAQPVAATPTVLDTPTAMQTATAAERSTAPATASPVVETPAPTAAGSRLPEDTPTPAATSTPSLTPTPALYERLGGDEVVHRVAGRDSIEKIARAAGVSPKVIIAMNGLKGRRLHRGQRLVVSTRHILPITLSDGIVINIGERRLYWVQQGSLVAEMPVGVGRIDWSTPPGEYTIVSRRRDPVWHVPPSIQKEMKERGKPVKTRVRPGPKNPLGKFWLQLSVPGYGIHGTNAPWTVGKDTTHGCVRLRPQDIERLYNEVPDGTIVDVINQPVKLARLTDGHVYIEAHAVEDDAGIPAEDLAERLRAAGLADIVDLGAAQRALDDTWGIAVDVTRH